MNLNKVTLIGRLTRDPEIRSTSGGQSVATLSLATNRFWKDKNGQRQDKTEFHTVILWGRLAEIAGQYLTKGQEAFVEGRMETRKYTAKDGTERRVTEVIAENMQLGSRAQGNSAPTSNSFTKNTTTTPAKAPVANNMPSEIDEEIPTINLDEESDEIRLEDVPF